MKIKKFHQFVSICHLNMELKKQSLMVKNWDKLEFVLVKVEMDNGLLDGVSPSDMFRGKLLKLQ